MKPALPSVSFSKRRGGAAGRSPSALLAVLLVPLLSAARPHPAEAPRGAAAPGASWLQEEESDMAIANRLLGEGRYEEAARRYRAIAKAEPQNALAWYRLGLALHLAKDFEGALPAHKRAASFERLRAPALYNVACAYSMLERTEEAVRWLSRARRAMVDDTDLISLMRTDPDLDWVRKDPRFAQIVEGTFSLPEELGGVRSCELPEGSDFDFRLGEWDVAWSGGQGRSVVERVLDKCIVREHFKSTDASKSRIEGLTLAAFVPSTGLWRQTWADNRGRLLVFDGEAREGRMVLEAADPDDAAARLRIKWFNIRPRSYDWEYERSTDDGETWELLWRVRYTRR